MINKINFFIIVGRGRSGTTLLSEIINNHKSVAIPGELFFIINLYKKYKNKKIDNKVINDFISDIFKEDRIKEYNFDENKLKQFLNLNIPINFNSLCLYTYINFASQQNKNNLILIGDKNPHYALFLKQIFNIFPNVKFIHIIRDYRDNILSFKNVYFDLNHTEALAYRWLYFNKRIAKYSRKYPQNFITIKYEDLVNSNEENIVKICNYLQIEYESKMLDFHKNNERYKLYTWHKNINIPINSNNVGKWEKKFTKSEIIKMDYICANFARKFGYKVLAKPSFIIHLKTIPGIIYGWAYTTAELSLFFVPLNLRTFLINSIRKIQEK